MFAGLYLHFTFLFFGTRLNLLLLRRWILLKYLHTLFFGSIVL